MGDIQADRQTTRPTDRQARRVKKRLKEIYIHTDRLAGIVPVTRNRRMITGFAMR